MKSTKIILFGATGMVGSRIVELLSKKMEIEAPTHLDVDLTDAEEIKRYLDGIDADYIVYSAGITRQDQAEEEKELALTLNAKVPTLIAKIASAQSTPLVYFSTDAVFDVKQSARPYNELDSINPVNYYGLTKSEGEQSVLSQSSKNLVMRLISVYTGVYKKKKDFARRVLDKLALGEKSEGITDLYFNPTYSDDVCSSLESAIEKKVSGILHVGATDIISNYDFMVGMAREFDFDEKLIKKTEFANFFKGHAAKRGQYTWLDTTKGQKILGDGAMHSNIFNLSKFKKCISFQ